VPTTPDPNEPTRADLPPVGGDDPTIAHDPIGAEPTRGYDPVGADAGVTRAYDPVVPEAGTATSVRDRRPVDDEDDRRRATWLWLLLGAVLIGLVLWALLRDEGDDVETSGDPAAQTTAPVEEGIEDPAASAPDDALAEEADDGAGPAPTEAPAEEPATGDEPATDAPAAGAATLTSADGTDLLGLIQGDAGDAERLAPHADADVTGSGLEVLDVVEGEGFWIGDDQRRIFAHGGDDLAATVEVGQRIDVEGFLKPNPPADSADVHDIPEDQGAELHRQQGHHIELRSITPAA